MHRSVRPSFARIVVGLVACLVAVSAAMAQVGRPVTPTFPNVPQVPGRLLSGLNAPEQGRTAIIAYHGGVLFTVPEVPSSQPGADFQVRTWDISDPTRPVETGRLGTTPMPINAHGYFQSGEYLTLGANWPPDAPWSFRTRGSGTPIERTEFPGLQGAGVRGNLFQPWYAGPTWWTYNAVSGNAELSLRGVQLASWDHLGRTGVIGHPFIIGDLLIFASDQSRTGVATYDISDPRNPVLLDVLTTGGPGGYWPEVWGGDGRLFVVFPYREGGNGIRVVDATDPTDLRLLADTPLPGAECMYVQFQDDRAFTGDHVVDMRTFQSVLDLDGANVTRTSDGGRGVDTSQFALPLGNLLITGGVGPNEGMAIWAHQAEPDTRGPSVGYHRPEAGRTNWPLEAPISLLIHETLETFTIVNGETFIVRPVGGSPLPGTLIFAFDDILTFTPDAPLLPDTTYEVILPAGGIKDAAGNGIAGHSFTFSTGGSVAGNGPPVVSSVSPATWPASPGALLRVTADATDPDGDSLEYRFDWGDGSPRTAWLPTAFADHAWTTPGHYQVTVQARDPSGALATGGVTVTVAVAPSGPQPSRSSSIVVDAARRLAWSVNPDEDSIAAIDADDLDLLVEMPTCEDPRSVALAPDGTIWVACHDGDAIRVHDEVGGTIVTIPLGQGSAPSGLAFSPDGSAAWVALEGAGALARIDAATRTETSRLAVGSRPRAIAVSADSSRVLVTRYLSVGDDGEVIVVDAAGPSLRPGIRVPKQGGDGNRDTTAAGKGIVNQLASIALSPDGTRAWIAATKANSERGTLSGPDLDQDNSVRNVVVQVDPATSAVARVVDLDNSDSASAVAYSPLGDYLFVALQGNDEIVVLDALRVDGTSGLGSLVTRLGAGGAPQGLAVDPVTSRTFVQNLTTMDVTVLETAELFTRGARTVASRSVSTVRAPATPGEILLGKRLFYHAGDQRMSAEGYLSCATCHADGDHDGRTWDFTGRGEGLRNTTSLRGRSGVGHGNVHWSANFDEIQDFEGDIRNAFGGRGFLADADWLATRDPLGAPKAGLDPDLDALAAYVSSLGRESVPRSPHRAATGFLTPDGLAGRDVFIREGCASCHAGEDFTDSATAPQLRDVGTLRTTSGSRLGGPLAGIDTPTLLGIFSTAPYLHDGTAATLEDVFRLAGGIVIPAETGAPASGAYIVDRYTDLNNDDTLRGRAYVELEAGSLTLSGVDGGAGGLGALSIRYSAGWPTNIDVTVNGVARNVAVAATPNVPQWRQTYWRELRIDDVALTPGTTNVIVVSAGRLGIDEILVTRADEIARAQPHRRVLALPQAERDALLSYVLQIDGRAEEPGPLAIVSLRVAASDVTWDAVPGAAGYDVLRGDLALLHASGGDFAAATTACEADDLPATRWSHGGVAPPAWFLVRATAPGMPAGSWDSGDPRQPRSREAGIAASPSACP